MSKKTMTRDATILWAVFGMVSLIQEVEGRTFKGSEETAKRYVARALRLYGGEQPTLEQLSESARELYFADHFPDRQIVVH